MTSQLDHDQGGTYRPKSRMNMGPSIGWIDVPAAILRVTVAGTTNLLLGNTVVTVNFNGAVTIQLPAFKGTEATISNGIAADLPISIIDTGLFAGANPITILPATGELISGLASVQIASAGGGIVLQPDPINGGCTVVS